MRTLVLLLTLLVIGVYSQPHSIRFLHGSVDGFPTDIYINGKLAFPSKPPLNYGGWTDYTMINGNVSQYIELRLAGDYASYAQFEIPREDFDVHRPQTVVFYGTLGFGISWRMIEHVCQPFGKGAWVNALHLYHGLENVDILINGAAICTGTDPNADRLLWPNVFETEYTDMKKISNPSKSPFNVTVSLTRDPHPVIFHGMMSAQDGHTYTIVLLGENSVDPFSLCGFRGTGVEASCPGAGLKPPTWVILPSMWVPTCSVPA